MQTGRSAQFANLQSRLGLLGSALLLAAFGKAAIANPVPADQTSLYNGQALYRVHCSQCHGWDPYRHDVSSLVEEETAEEQLAAVLEDLEAAAPPPPEKDLWPEWAPRPRPSQDEIDSAETLESQMLGDITLAVDDIYGAGEGNLQGLGDAADIDAIYGVEQAPANDVMVDETLGATALRQPGATDLTDPLSFHYGTAEQDLYFSIASGTGVGMQGFSDRLPEESIWDLVNYLRSRWGREWLDN
ncbi:MAG: hypothetical protein AAGA91_06545 [Pseudomonadota bacterium]